MASAVTWPDERQEGTPPAASRWGRSLTARLQQAPGLARQGRRESDYLIHQGELLHYRSSASETQAAAFLNATA
jgi:hypothetical protein